MLFFSSCRVSAQSVGEVGTGDTVVKGAGDENKVVGKTREVWCRDGCVARRKGGVVAPGFGND